MIARAPGKLVLSGAYSVLEGAKAIVTAVDRYAMADTSRLAERETAEVRAAIDAAKIKRAPWFDASNLRATLPDGRNIKLGLGSSAAILVASMTASWAAEDRTLDSRALLWSAIAAHRSAQRGGSGIDVAAAVFGGTVVCRIALDRSLKVSPHDLPEGIEVHVFASTSAASTPELVRRVRSLAAHSRPEYNRLMTRLKETASATVAASKATDFLDALREQAKGLLALGEAAGAPIFTPDVVALAPLAEAEGALFYPSGAGGGDVALYVGKGPPSERFHTEATVQHRFYLPMKIGAPGAHIISTSSPPSGKRPAL